MVTPPDSSRAPLLKAWLGGALALALIGFMISAAIVELPYYAFRPGTVRDTRSLVSVDGTETFRPQGSISYTTVSLSPVTLLGLLRGWLDADIDIHSRDEVLGNQNAEENREANLAMMDESKVTATKVALEELGYTVHETATGNVVVEVMPGSPAEDVLEPGDTIVAVDGQRIDEPNDLTNMLAGKRPGDEVTLTVQPFVRGTDLTGSRPREDRADEDVTVALMADPGNPEQDEPPNPDRGIIGIHQLATGRDVETPIDVSFDTGDVGGPSAGLAFTLALIDELTPGELTGGRDVAATGEIESDGSVARVGGTGQKAAAVRHEGMDVFLVPDDAVDYREARQHAGDVQVIRVGSLDEALAALADLGGNGLALPQVGAPSPSTPAS